MIKSSCIYLPIRMIIVKIIELLRIYKFNRAQSRLLRLKFVSRNQECYRGQVINTFGPRGNKPRYCDI